MASIPDLLPLVAILQQDSEAGPSVISRNLSESRGASKDEYDNLSSDASTDDDDEDDCFQPSTDGGSESEWPGDEESDEGGPSIGRQSHPSVGVGRNSGQNAPTRIIRSIRACTTQDKGTGTIARARAPSPTRAFTFLQLESYSCTCSPTPNSNPSRAPTDASAPTATRCKVLLYFGMLFLDSMQAIFCPTHHCFVPMACWAEHVRRSHLDWVSSTKVEECSRMAEHVALSCGLDLKQDVEDLQLPDKIDRPLALTVSSVHLSLQCPKCGCWMAQDQASSQPDRYMRRHLKTSCPEGPWPDDYARIRLAECRWTYRVSISRGKSHVFLLPDSEGWDAAIKAEETPQLPGFPPLVPTDSSFESARVVSQDWPFRLGWTAYDQEISASEHIAALQQLISKPTCGCRRKIRNQDFLEEGLHLIDHALAQYFKAAMVFIHEKHKAVVDAVVPE